MHGPQTSCTVTPEAAAQTGLAAGTRRSLPVPVTPRQRPSAWVWWSRARPFSVWLLDVLLLLYGPLRGHYVSPQGNGALKGGKAFTAGHLLSGRRHQCGGHIDPLGARDLLYSKELDAEKQGGENAYAVMAREAAAVPPGSDGLIMLPYIYGERSPLQDAEATGMLFGLKGTHGRAQINRAALEAVGYSTYQHLLLFEELGVRPGGSSQRAAARKTLHGCRSSATWRECR